MNELIMDVWILLDPDEAISRCDDGLSIVPVQDNENDGWRALGFGKLGREGFEQKGFTVVKKRMLLS